MSCHQFDDAGRLKVLEQQRIALGFRPQTIAGWLFYLRVWAWADVRGWWRS